MIQMLRKGARSGNIHDFAHVRTELCLSDCLTKATTTPEALIKTVETGVLREIDIHPPFRTLLKHKDYAVPWLQEHLSNIYSVCSFLAEPITDIMWLDGVGPVVHEARAWKTWNEESHGYLDEQD